MKLTILVLGDVIRASFYNFPIMVWLSIDHHDSNIETRCRMWENCNKEHSCHEYIFRTEKATKKSTENQQVRKESNFLT